MASNEDTWWQVSSLVNIYHNNKKSSPGNGSSRRKVLLPGLLPEGKLVENDSKFAEVVIVKTRAVVDAL